MNICILGRQPQLSIAELEMRYGSSAIVDHSDLFALVDAEIHISSLGGSIKAAKLLTELDTTNPQKVFDFCRRELPKHAAMRPEGKLQLGVSLYGLDMPLAKLNANVLSLKKAIRQTGRSVRVVPNTSAALSSAQTYHNHMTGTMGMELVFVRSGKKTLLGQVTGVQNIDALAARDQARPKTDSFVGMLPPKLALMMLNLSGIKYASSPTKSTKTASHRVSVEHSSAETLAADVSEDLSASGSPTTTPARVTSGGAAPKIVQPTDENFRGGPDGRTRGIRILDPFCGTGVVLQEAALLGYDVYGTDLSEKMVDYSTANMKWLAEKFGVNVDVSIHHGDAIETTWQKPIEAVVAETYLGQPFSAPPSAEKLAQVKRICNEIITKFLENIHSQLEPGTPLCLAVPAWRDSAGRITHLPLVNKLPDLGYKWQTLTHGDKSDLLYYREDQVVARQLLLLTRS